MHTFHKKLTDAAELIGGDGLSGPEHAKRVRADKAGN